MAPTHNQPNQVHLLPFPLSFSSEHRRRRCSKAQRCFFNILHIISAFPTVDVTDEKSLSNDNEICENRGFAVDLNIRLRPPPEAERFDCPAMAFDDAVGDNCVFEKNDQGESESIVADDYELAVEERATEHSEISHVGDQSSGVDYNGVVELVVEEEKPRDEGCLGLLIEAAQLILGYDSEQNKKPATSKVEPSRGAKRKPQCWTAAAEAEWYAEFEDASPVVKSKRGRNQVLPYKYRDSVVEPLVRWTSSTSSHRSISNAAVRSRRRSK